MDFEKSIALLIGRMKGFALKTGCKDDSADLAQEAFIRCFSKVRANQDYQKRAQEDPTWFEHYTFRALINLIINYKKRKKTLAPYLDEKGNERSDLVDKDVPTDYLIIEDQKHIIMKKFILELRELLTDEEKKFIDIFLELAEESDKINISLVGKLLGLPADKAHNTWRRIIAIAEDLEAKKKRLEDISTKEITLGSAIYHMFCDTFEGNLEDELTPDSLALARKCIANLSLSDISLLSKII